MLYYSNIIIFRSHCDKSNRIVYDAVMIKIKLAKFIILIRLSWTFSNKKRIKPETLHTSHFYLCSMSSSSRKIKAKKRLSENLIESAHFPSLQHTEIQEVTVSYNLM